MAVLISRKDKKVIKKYNKSVNRLIMVIGKNKNEKLQLSLKLIVKKILLIFS